MGGGGGGGYYGGGSGIYVNPDTAAGGGGGSGYYNPTYVTGGTLTAGSGTTPGNSSDAYRGSAGAAGTNVGQTGASGAVILM
jgi:hypothetical protein